MKNNILIIDTASELSALTDFFEELSSRDCALHFLTSRNNAFNFLPQYQRHTWPLSLHLHKTGRAFLLTVLYPTYLALTLITLLVLKYRQKISTLVCLGCFEKLVFTPVAKLLGLKIIWLELPGEKNFELKGLLKKLYLLLARLSTLVTFSAFHEKTLLRQGLKAHLLKTILLGIKLNNFSNQENIFNQLAETDHQTLAKKFFTIGTVADLNEPQRVEILFQTIKKCLTVIHHLQLIVIGDGSERKNLNWLAKKMDIDAVVWFVGEQKNPRRWFDNFDVYVVASETFDLRASAACLRAMSAQVPIIGPDNIGVEDVLSHNQNGLLVEAGNSESLAQAIIKLQQDKRKIKLLAQNALATVESKHNLIGMVDKFAKIANLT